MLEQIFVMDEKDRLIISILQENSRLSTRQISKKAQLPITTVHNRIKKMNKEGIIKNYTIVPDYKKLGMSVVAYVLMSVDYKDLKKGEETKKELQRLLSNDGIIENLSFVTGVTDALIRIRTTDIDALNNFLINKLRQTDFAEKTETLIVLKDY